MLHPCEFVRCEVFILNKSKQDNYFKKDSPFAEEGSSNIFSNLCWSFYTLFLIEKKFYAHTNNCAFGGKTANQWWGFFNEIKNKNF